jgi:hypothetical protein
MTIGVVRELLREPSQESRGAWRAASVFLPRSEARLIRIPRDGWRTKSARRDARRLTSPSFPNQSTISR